jgi:alkyl sulfatase BDS1-like metallo-beta-lactamase superfamily hydrolase
MGKVRDLAEALWTGTSTTFEHNPLTTFAGLEELQDGLAFVSGLANVVAVASGDGLVLVDTGSQLTGALTRSQVTGWNDAAVHTAIYTHGHVDHVCGMPSFEAGGHRARVIAHEAVPARFDRYKLTAGYNGAINARQFRAPGLRWPTEYRYPDVTYRDALDLEVGGLRLELRHDRGETDDSTWVWLPERRALCTGDLFIWAAPNCGNPQKVQRYPREWARALRRMAELDAELLLPGHGPPILGADRIAEALADTAALLEIIHDRTVELMNEGLPLDDVIDRVEIPPALLRKPYLRPVYDDPEFIVRNIWRLYGGWYDGNPAHLKPAHRDALAAEVAALAGGAPALAARARALADGGDLTLACHLIAWAFRAAPDHAEVRAAHTEIFAARAEAEPSLMATSIYRAAAEDSK